MNLLVGIYLHVFILLGQLLVDLTHFGLTSNLIYDDVISRKKIETYSRAIRAYFFNFRFRSSFLLSGCSSTGAVVL